MKGHFSTVKIVVMAFAIALTGVSSLPAIAGTKVSEPAKAEALCRRVLGDKYAKSFVFKQISSEGDCADVFTVSSSGKKIVIGGNTFMYEFVLENAWNIPRTADVENYATLIADRHCGKRSIEARDAWKILLHSVYCKGRPNSGMATKITSRPTLSKNYRYGKTSILYDNNDLLSAIKLLLDVDSHADAYEFDLVNFTRQWLGNRFGEKLDEYAGAARKADLDGMDRISAEMKQMIADTDALLSLRTEFSLGQWIDDARSWGTNEAEKLYFEKNARNLITTWGRPDSGLNDYANRGLSGLTRSFYGVRWNMFFDAVRNAVADHKAYNDDDAKEFHKNVCKFEGQWWDECRDSFTVKDNGDVKTTVRNIIRKYQ